MENFNIDQFPQGFRKSLKYQYIKPELKDQEDLRTDNPINYEMWEKILQQSSDKNYPYYVFKITEYALSLKEIPEALNKIFATIDFMKLAEKSLKAQPNLKTKLDVFFMIMGFFYDGKLLNKEESFCNNIIKIAAENLDDYLVSRALNEPHDDDSVKDSEFIPLYETLKNVMHCYYECMILKDQEAKINDFTNCAFHASRINNFLNCLGATFLYHPVLLALMEADYQLLYDHLDYSDYLMSKSNLIENPGFNKPEELSALMALDYKKALLSVAEFPLFKKNLSISIDDNINDSGQNRLLRYLQETVFKNQEHALYELLEKIVSSDFWERIVKINANSDIAKLHTKITAERDEQERQQALEKLVTKACSKALEPLSRQLEIIANALRNIENRLADLEKRLPNLEDNPNKDSQAGPSFFSGKN